MGQAVIPRRTTTPRPARRSTTGRSVWLQWMALLSLPAVIWFWPAPSPTPPVRTGTRTNWDGFQAVAYDSIRARPQDGALSGEGLREHLLALEGAGYQPISLEEAGEFLRCRAPLPEKAVLLTFNDGRRESVHEAEKVLKERRWPAVMFVRAEPMEKSDYTYPTWRDLRGLVSTGRWSFGSLGLSAATHVDIEGGPRRGLFLVSRAFLPREARTETKEEWEVRVREEMRASTEVIRRRLPGVEPGAFIFPCSNDGGAMDDGGKALRHIVAEAFPLAFAGMGYALNDARRSPLQLTRLAVQPGWSGGDLVARLNAQGARRSRFTPASEGDWTGKRGRLRIEGRSVVLDPEEAQGAEAWLAGSEPWRCVSGEATFETHPGVQSWIFLRAVPGGRHIRIGWTGRRIEVQTRVYGEDCVVLAYGTVIKGATRAKVSFDLFDRRIRFAVENGEAPARSFPLPREIEAGMAGLGMWLLAAGSGSAVFGDLRLQPRPARALLVHDLEEGRTAWRDPVDVLAPAWYHVPASGGGEGLESGLDPALLHLAAFRGASVWPLIRFAGRPSAASLDALASTIDRLARLEVEGLILDPRPAQKCGQPIELSDLLDRLVSVGDRLGVVLPADCDRSLAELLWNRVRWLAIPPEGPAAQWMPPERLLLLEEPSW